MASDFTAMRKKQIGEFVRSRRESKGLSRRELGEKIGYDKGADVYIGSFERGRTYIPPEKIRLVKEALGCEYEDLIP